jgi:hypothetical protein
VENQPALAVWEQPGHGGNGDGIIDPADAIWPRLRLWQDADHDGKVQPGELHPLAAFGITGISVHYRPAGGADRYGNRYGLAAAVFGSGHAASLVYDFYLTAAPAFPPGDDWPLAAAAGAVALAGAALAARRRRPARGRTSWRPGSPAARCWYLGSARASRRIRRCRRPRTSPPATTCPGPPGPSMVVTFGAINSPNTATMPRRSTPQGGGLEVAELPGPRAQEALLV